MKLIVLSEAKFKAPEKGFKYAKRNVDTSPRIVVIGENVKHSGTGNDLLIGINLNYLSKKEEAVLRRALPTIWGNDKQRGEWATIGWMTDHADSLRGMKKEKVLKILRGGELRLNEKAANRAYDIFTNEVEIDDTADDASGRAMVRARYNIGKSGAGLDGNDKLILRRVFQEFYRTYRWDFIHSLSSGELIYETGTVPVDRAKPKSDERLEQDKKQDKKTAASKSKKTDVQQTREASQEKKELDSVGAGTKQDKTGTSGELEKRDTSGDLHQGDVKKDIAAVDADELEKDLSKGKTQKDRETQAAQKAEEEVAAQEADVQRAKAARDEHEASRKARKRQKLANTEPESGSDSGAGTKPKFKSKTEPKAKPKAKSVPKLDPLRAKLAEILGPTSTTDPKKPKKRKETLDSDALKKQRAGLRAAGEEHGDLDDRAKKAGGDWKMKHEPENDAGDSEEE